jgi:hypothetical protein
MIDGTLIRDALVAAWQTVPQLVALLANDFGRIVAYSAEGPSSEATMLGVLTDSPKVFVRYDGFERGGEMDPWTHSLTVAFRSNPAYCTHEQLQLALINGIVPASGLPMKNHQLLDSIYAADFNSSRREADENGLDYFRMSVAVKESGDE